MAVATVIEATLVGQQIRVNLKLPSGVAQPNQGLFVSALSGSVIADVAAQVRPINSGDERIKNNLAALAPGTAIDLTEPVITPPTPTPDDLAVAAFAPLVQAYRIARNKDAVGIPTVDVAGAAAAVVTAYTTASKAAQARMDLMFGGPF